MWQLHDCSNQADPCLKCNAKLTFWIKWTLRLITKIACGNVDVRETSNNVKAIDGLYHKA